MRKVTVFNFVTLNGYFQGPKGDLSWHRHGEEESKYAGDKLQQENVLLFGRVTYEHMAAYWPTPEAIKSAPEVAKGMNKAEKIVFSRTLKEADWNNTKLVKDNLIDAVKQWKTESGKDITVLGSGSIVTQLAEAGLIDEYGIMIDPVALGEGTPLFNGMKGKLDLDLVSAQPFKSGVLFLTYLPLNNGR
jgi:dihydrofolate reductase